jgi:Trp operon repressor
MANLTLYRQIEGQARVDAGKPQRSIARSYNEGIATISRRSLLNQ